MFIPLFGLAKAEHTTTINAVLAALASGPQMIHAQYALKSSPEVSSHRVMLHMSATQSMVDEFAAMTQGILPAINGEWGVDGIPTGAEAVAALTGGNLKIVAGYGIDDSSKDEWIAGQLAGFAIQPYSIGA